MFGLWRLFQGHIWTVGPHLQGRASRRRTDGSTFSVRVEDTKLGPVELAGRLFDRGRSRALLIVVHGLGGSSQSAYVGRALSAAEESGLACALVNLRGADLSGEDVYHAGLFSDLAAFIDCPALERYGPVYLLGYSLGGHIALGAGVERRSSRLAAVAAICSPLDLDNSATAFDRPACWPYRRHVLAALKASYAAVARRRGWDASPQRLGAIRTIRDWDSTIIAPRFGFRDAADYYREVSIGPRLGQLQVPGLYVAAIADPMVPFHTVAPLIAQPAPKLEVRRLTAGGHVGFPADCSLGLPGGVGLERQALAWLRGNG